MDADVLEEAITDWHRLGHAHALPCEEILRLRCYLNAPPRRATYLPHHLKTVKLFTFYALQLRFWQYVDRMLADIIRYGMNEISLRAEELLRRPLLPEEVIWVGHRCLVDVPKSSPVVVEAILADPAKLESVLREHTARRFVNSQSGPVSRVPW